MSVEKLISFIGQPNIAEKILKQSDGEQLLKRLATQVIEDYGRDLDSMTGWSQDVDEGRALAKQETRGKSQPWEGASNFKSPAILEASITFGDRASTELLRGRNLVKIDIIGSDTQKTKRKSADNASEYMNWQLNHQMRDWRKKQESLLYELPSTGTVFKKTFFDPIEGRNKSELIHYPDFVVNQATTDIDEALSFTHPMDISQNMVFERQAAGLWLDVDIYPETTDAEGEKGSNEEQGVIAASDNTQQFLEQNCFFDLDDDGYSEPYIVTVHKQSKQVVRIVARFDKPSLIVVDKSGNIGPLGDFDASGLDLVRIIPEQNITKYGFIRNPDGTFLDIGYYHILGGLSKGINSTANQLLDAGSLANLQGGFLARGFRKRMGNLKTKPGSWESTNIAASDLRNGVLPHQFKEPSATLFQLNQQLNQEVDQLIVNTDLKGVLSPNAPATTTLALIQEAMLPVSAIMQRIVRAESEEFRKLFVLNSKFSDPLTYQKVLDDPEANYQRDFDLGSLDIMTTANSEMSSRMQRIQLAEILISQSELLTVAGGDVRPIYEFWFDALGANDVKGQVFPDPNQVNEEQAARLEGLQEQQRQKAQLLAIQVDHAERDVVRREAETRAKLAETAAKIREVQSNVVLNLEKAETEQAKNEISLYTAQLQGVSNAIDSTIKELDREDKREERNEEKAIRETERAAPIPLNIAR